MTRAGLRLLPLLLCFWPETAGSINPAMLRVTVDHVNCNGGVNSQYAFAITLPHATCSNPQNVATYLPTTQLADMRETIRPSGALYNPPSGNIVAAQPNEVIMPSGNTRSTVPGRMPRTGLLLLPLLLCFGPETTGSINPAALKQIVDYVNDNGGVNKQYAFAASLPHDTCNNPQNVSTYLPMTQLKVMRETIRSFGALYNPPRGHIVAARPKEVITPSGKYTEHSEWRLLSGQNSLVAQLTARTYRRDSCLILFTFNSPCSTKCLAEAGRSNIVGMTSNAFFAMDNNYKAFVFQSIFSYDMKPEVTRQALLDAWHRLCNVPLLRCDNNGCQDCTATDPENNPCLAGKA
ncbi:hypothetical protein DR999_PMT20706 [Platysternon megacephalum]|uniref:Uncharacterized protein n=1 Tax=Platysternon megacephalum TaxID=55544 RepID=A0A4D9DJ07_9SAUR|nr:hypothetical protein DR999_PMT20706 [Platysternon megacephalum]